VTNIRMCLKFKVARTPQFAVQGIAETSNFRHMHIIVPMATLNGP